MAPSSMPTAARLAKSRQLAEVSRSLTCAMSVAEVMQFTVSQAASLLDTDKAVLLIHDAQGSLTVRASIGDADALASRFASQRLEPLSPQLEALFGGAELDFLGVPLVVGGQISGVLAVAGNGTALPKAEQEFLLSALADQAAIAIEQVQLGETARVRERLIGIVSHDLRSPITAISLVAQSLLRKKRDEAYVAAAALRIHRSAERATRMVRDLLDFTQFQLGAGVQLQPRCQDLASVVGRTIEEAKQVHPGRHIELHCRGDVQGRWDADRLEQAVGNVLANALAYSPATSTVHVGIVRRPAAVELSVRNEGEPIGAERLPHIFEPMQRGGLTPNVGRSVGLGLYIVKTIVEAHRGSIDVASSAALGTTVTLRLPPEVDGPSAVA